MMLTGQPPRPNEPVVSVPGSRAHGSSCLRGPSIDPSRRDHPIGRIGTASLDEFRGGTVFVEVDLESGAPPTCLAAVVAGHEGLGLRVRVDHPVRGRAERTRQVRGLDRAGAGDESPIFAKYKPNASAPERPFRASLRRFTLKEQYSNAAGRGHVLPRAIWGPSSPFSARLFVALGRRTFGACASTEIRWTSLRSFDTSCSMATSLSLPAGTDVRRVGPGTRPTLLARRTKPWGKSTDTKAMDAPRSAALACGRGPAEC